MSTTWGADHPLFQPTVQLDQAAISYPWTQAQWLETFTPSYSVFHWPEESPLKGFALYQLAPLEKLAHLLKIAVVPEFRGKGEAKMFWESQVLMLRTQGYERIYLEVATNNPYAMGFYRKMGFRMLHKVRGFYKDGQDAWTMELAI